MGGGGGVRVASSLSYYLVNLPPRSLPSRRWCGLAGKYGERTVEEDVLGIEEPALRHRRAHGAVVKRSDAGRHAVPLPPQHKRASRPTASVATARTKGARWLAARVKWASMVRAMRSIRWTFAWATSSILHRANSSDWPAGGAGGGGAE